MKGKILFIDKPHPLLEEELKKMGFDCFFFPDISYEALLNTAQEYTGYVIRNKFAIDKTLLDRSVNLRFVARVGAGMENIDVDYAQKKQIRCINSPEGNADAVAEYVIGELLFMLRGLKKADAEVRQGIWNRTSNIGFELSGKTFGIVGYGTMGKRVASKLSALGCSVIAYDKFKTGFSDNYATEVSLQELQAKADIVSIHINYLPENHYFIDQKCLNGFKKNIFLINSSRGKVLHTKDLVSCLESGKVRFAALDVLEYENMQLQNKPIEQWGETMRYLAASDRVLLSPHIAGQTFEAPEKHAKILIQKIKKVFE